MKIFSALLITARFSLGHNATDEHDEHDTVVQALSGEAITDSVFSTVYELEREERARKSQAEKKPPKTSNDVHLPDPILGDEPEGRGQHRCGNVPIPPIVCVGGKCPQGKHYIFYKTIR